MFSLKNIWDIFVLFGLVYLMGKLVTKMSLIIIKLQAWIVEILYRYWGYVTMALMIECSHIIMLTREISSEFKNSLNATIHAFIATLISLTRY